MHIFKKQKVYKYLHLRCLCDISVYPNGLIDKTPSFYSVQGGDQAQAQKCQKSHIFYAQNNR